MAGAAGGALCLTGRLSAPVRQWLPQLASLAVMPAMAPGVSGRDPLIAATAVLVAALLWQVCERSPYHRPVESVNLAVMAALTAAAAVVERNHHGGGGPVGAALWPVLFAVACWAVVRAAGMLVRQAWPSRRSVPHPAAMRVPLLGEAGGALMVTTMTAMLVVP